MEEIFNIFINLHLDFVTYWPISSPFQLLLTKITGQYIYTTSSVNSGEPQMKGYVAILTVGILLISPIMILDGEAADDGTWVLGGWNHQITSDENNQMDPDMFEDLLVYESGGIANGDIFLYNFANGTESRLTSNTRDQFDPAVWGDRVVYTDYRNGAPDIYMFNLTTWKETRITDDPSTQQNPDIYGDLIVYEDDRGSGYSIYMYDISSGEEEEIYSHIVLESDDPKIYGDHVCWWNADGNVKLYTISTDTITPLATREMWRETDIWGDFLVYTEIVEDGTRNGYHNIGSGHSKPLESDSLWQKKVVIQGSTIAWLDWEDGYKLFTQNLDTGIVKQVLLTGTYINSDDGIALYGDRLAYVIYNDDQFDVSYIELDMDHDGVLDSLDLFPDNPNESSDLDGDHMGDNADPDADGDGVLDSEDAFYLDPTEWSDFDGDGTGDNADEDDDNDGVPDESDPKPKDPMDQVIIKLDLILEEVLDLNESLGSRLDSLESDLLASISDLDTSMESDLLDILSRLEQIQKNLSGIIDVDTDHNQLGNLSEMIEAGFDDLGNMVDSMVNSINRIMEDPALNSSEDLITMLEQLMVIQDMMDDMEELNEEVSSQGDEISSAKNSNTIMSMIIIVLLLILIVVAVMGLVRRSTVRDSSDME